MGVCGGVCVGVCVCVCVFLIHLREGLQPNFKIVLSIFQL